MGRRFRHCALRRGWEVGLAGLAAGVALPSARGAGCTCDHGSTHICCGQAQDMGQDHCGGKNDHHICPADKPKCSGYVENQRLGECVAASCSPGMIGAGVACPAHTVGGPGTCIVKHDQAQKVCDATPDCEYIDVCNNKPWNDRHPDCVQLSKPPLTVNYEWLSCKPGTEPGAPASDVGAYFVLLLALVGGV